MDTERKRTIRAAESASSDVKVFHFGSLRFFEVCSADELGARDPNRPPTVSVFDFISRVKEIVSDDVGVTPHIGVLVID